MDQNNPLTNPDPSKNIPVSQPQEASGMTVPAEKTDDSSLPMDASKGSGAPLVPSSASASVPGSAQPSDHAVSPLSGYELDQKAYDSSGANPYSGSRIPPSYHKTEQFSVQESELLAKYMSAPKYVAARDLIASPIVLFYALSVTAILLFDFLKGDYLHPFYVLLCIGAWISYISGSKSRKTNTLPSVSGVSICAGVCTAKLVLACIVIGLFILLLGTVIVISLIHKTADGNFIMVTSIILAIMILILWFLVKFYSTQARNLKTVKYCIANGDMSPKRISIFPSVIYIIMAVISTISLAMYQTLTTNFNGYLDDFIRSTRLGLSSLDLPYEQVEKVISIFREYFNFNEMGKTIIVASVLIILNYLSIALFFFRTSSVLNVHLSDYDFKPD